MHGTCTEVKSRRGREFGQEARQAAGSELRSPASAAPADGRGARPPSGPPSRALPPPRPAARSLRTGRLAHRVGERFQVVTAGAGGTGGVGEPDDLPAARRGEALGVLGAQVVAVGFGVGGERAEDRGRVGVDVRQRRDGGTAASGARTATYRAHDVGRYRTLERAATTLPQVTPPCRAVRPPTRTLRARRPDLGRHHVSRCRTGLKPVTTWCKPVNCHVSRRSWRDTESSPSLAGMVIQRHPERAVDARWRSGSRRVRNARSRIRNGRGRRASEAGAAAWARAGGRAPDEDYSSSVMDNPVPPRAAAPGPRRRDRHGRGMRGPVAPPQVPLAASRAEVFADLVQDSVERLERRWPQLADIDFLVLEVPRLDGSRTRAGATRRYPWAARSRRARTGPRASSSTAARSRSAPRAATSAPRWCTRSSWSRSPSCWG